MVNFDICNMLYTCENHKGRAQQIYSKIDIFLISQYLMGKYLFI